MGYLHYHVISKKGIESLFQSEMSLERDTYFQHGMSLK